MKLLFWKYIGTVVALQLVSSSDDGTVGNQTLIEDLPSTEDTMTKFLTESTTEEKTNKLGTTEDPILLKETFTTVEYQTESTRPDSSTHDNTIPENSENERIYTTNTETELNVTLEKENGFNDISTTPTHENLTAIPKVNDLSNSEENDQFTIFMIQKQCSSNKSGGEVFDMYSDLKLLVEEVDDCLYFAFIKVRASSPPEIKEAMLKFEEKQFHVIKVKQKAGNQDKSRLVLKEHLDCKECLAKGRDIKLAESGIDSKNPKSDENQNKIYDINNASFYLALAGSILALSVVIINIYLCHFRRKQGRSEIPRFNSKPEKFNIGPIPRPTILNGDSMLQNPYISGIPVNSLRSTEQQAYREGSHPRNDNRITESRRWMPKKSEASKNQQNPFTNYPKFGAW